MHVDLERCRGSGDCTCDVTNRGGVTPSAILRPSVHIHALDAVLTRTFLGHIHAVLTRTFRGVQVWDLRTLRLLHELDACRPIALIGDRQLVTSYPDSRQSLRVWQVPPPQQIGTARLRQAGRQTDVSIDDTRCAGCRCPRLPRRMMLLARMRAW